MAGLLACDRELAMTVRVGVFHPGTQHSWQTALAMQEGRQLGWYATSIFYDPAKWPYRVERLLPVPAARRAHGTFLRRYTPQLDPALVRQLGYWGWIAGALHSLPGNRLATAAVYPWNRAFGRQVINLVEREPVDALWGYDTASLEVFRWAKRRGIFCVLDRAIGHGVTANRVLGAEYARHPEFFSSPFVPKPQRLLDEEQEEMALADLIVVGSPFCANTLIENGCDAHKIRVLAYGFDERRFPGSLPRRTIAENHPINFLFVGNLAPRKGIAYLLQAFAAIPERLASLTLVGRMSMSPLTFEKYAKRVTHVPTVSREKVIDYFCNADCFIFPSLFEGSALVLREIYGAGLGAVHTAAAGSGATHGLNGLIVEPASVEAIIAAVGAVVRDCEQMRRWQQASWDMRPSCTWAKYRVAARDLLAAELR